jgi:hypothetical protein
LPRQARIAPNTHRGGVLGGRAGEKRYPTAAEAVRNARAFDGEDREAIGQRTPLSLLPLRFGRGRQ